MPNPIYFDRRKQTTATTGTGALTLAVPSGPWSKLNTAGVATITISYCIAHQTASDWETGVGTIDSTSTTLTRTAAVDGSAGAGALVNFSAGNKDVFITPIAANVGRVNPATCNGRLTLVSGNAVPDTASGTTIYFTPYQGCQIAIPEPSYGTGQWKLFDFTELSLSLATASGGVGSDIFIYDNAGVLTLGLQTWLSGSARTTAINYLDGIPFVGAASAGKRYLGSIYCASTGTTVDSPKQRWVWNYANQVGRRMINSPQTGQWSLTGTLSWRGQNSDATKARAVEFMIGLGPFVPVQVLGSVYVGLVSGQYVNYGLTLDGTGQPSTLDPLSMVECALAGSAVQVAEYNQMPAVGYHYLQPVEAVSSGSGSSTWYDYIAARFVGGLNGTIWA